MSAAASSPDLGRAYCALVVVVKLLLPAGVRETDCCGGSGMTSCTTDQHLCDWQNVMHAQATEGEQDTYAAADGNARESQEIELLGLAFRAQFKFNAMPTGLSIFSC